MNFNKNCLVCFLDDSYVGYIKETTFFPVVCTCTCVNRVCIVVCWYVCAQLAWLQPQLAACCTLVAMHSTHILIGWSLIPPLLTKVELIISVNYTMVRIVQLTMHIQPNKLALDPVWLTTSDALGLSCLSKKLDL